MGAVVGLCGVMTYTLAGSAEPGIDMDGAEFAAREEGMGVVGAEERVSHFVAEEITHGEGVALSWRFYLV
jgi:hypothetical protein